MVPIEWMTGGGLQTSGSVRPNTEGWTRPWGAPDSAQTEPDRLSMFYANTKRVRGHGDLTDDDFASGHVDRSHGPTMPWMIMLGEKEQERRGVSTREIDDGVAIFNWRFSTWRCWSIWTLKKHCAINHAWYSRTTLGGTWKLIRCWSREVSQWSTDLRVEWSPSSHPWFQIRLLCVLHGWNFLACFWISHMQAADSTTRRVENIYRHLTWCAYIRHHVKKSWLITSLYTAFKWLLSGCLEN